MIILPHCDGCDAATDAAEDDYGEILCENCRSNRVEAAWNRAQESLMDGTTPTMQEQHLAAWHQKQELKR